MQMRFILSGKVLREQEKTAIEYVVSPDAVTTAFVVFLFPWLWIQSILSCIKGTGNWAFFGAAIFVNLVFVAAILWMEKRHAMEFERAIKAAEDSCLPEEK